MDQTKKCPQCGEIKNHCEFSISKTAKNGLQGYCKVCRRFNQSNYRLRNLSKINEYRKKNLEHIKSYTSDWQKNNSDKISVYLARRRAKKKNNTHPLHNPQLEETLHQIRIRVSNCLKIPYEVDHIWPLSQGGPHHHDNLQVIPKSLNNTKRANLTFRHESLLDWTDLPIHLLKWIKENNSEQFKSAVKLWVNSGEYTLEDFKNHLKSKNV